MLVASELMRAERRWRLLICRPFRSGPTGIDPLFGAPFTSTERLAPETAASSGAIYSVPISDCVLVGEFEDKT